VVAVEAVRMNIDANIMVGFWAGMKIGFGCGLFVGMCFLLVSILGEKRRNGGKK